jgi:hypothetical protein
MNDSATSCAVQAWVAPVDALVVVVGVVVGVEAGVVVAVVA